MNSKPNYYEQKYYFPTKTIDVVVQVSFVSSKLRKPIKENKKQRQDLD